jgi:WD40 repeat protein
MLRLWDADTGKPLRTLEAAEPDITHCLFSPDGKRMISVCGASPEREPGSAVLQMWDVALGKEVRRFTVIQPVQQVHAVGMSEGGKRLMAAVEVGKAETTTQLYVWNTDSGKLLSQRSYKTEEHTRIRPSGMWWCKDHAAFAPDGERMSVWRGIEDVASGCLQAILPTEAGTPVVFSPDGRLLAEVILQPIPNSPTRFSEKGLCLLETATGEEILHWNIGSIDYVGFTPDGRGVVVADRERLSVWDTTTGARLHQMAWPRGEEAGEEPSAYALAVLPGGRAATSRMNGHILVWDLAASTWPTRRSTHDLERATLDALWSDLSDEARKANRAITTLAASPAQTVPFLQDRLPPLAALNAKRIDRLLADLASDSFAVREAASRQLASMRYRAEPTLRKALENKPSLEVRRRIESILAGPRRPPTEDLRRLRAIAVLERIGTPEARRILEKLSEAEAQAALRRLQRR